MTDRQVADTVTVVVPTRNSERLLEPCLASLQNQTHVPDEIIVCDGRSTDGTVRIARESGALLLRSDVANRSAQRNKAAEVASGHFLLFIDSDMTLGRKVIEECLATFRQTDAAIVIPEVFVGTSYWAKVRGFERAFYDGIWWMEAARWFRRSQFLKIGGYATDLVGPEDWDLDQRIRGFGDVRRISAMIDHNEGDTSLGSLLKKKAHYAFSLETFAERHPSRAALSLSPTRRSWLFIKRPFRLLQHPLLTAGIIRLGFAEVLLSRDGAPANSSSAERPISSSKSDFHEG